MTPCNDPHMNTTSPNMLIRWTHPMTCGRVETTKLANYGDDRPDLAAMVSCSWAGQHGMNMDAARVVIEEVVDLEA